MPAEKRLCTAWYPTVFQRKMRLNSVQICTIQTDLHGSGSPKLQICKEITGFYYSGSQWWDETLVGWRWTQLCFCKKKKKANYQGPWPECLNHRCLFKHRRISSRSSDQNQKTVEDERPQINISQGGQCVEKTNQSNN